MSKIETASKVSLKLTSMINLEMRGASSRLWQKRPPIVITDDTQNRNHKHSSTEAYQQDKPRNAKPPPPTTRKGPPPGQKRPIAFIGTINSKSGPQWQPQNHVQSRKYKQSATEAHQQNKPRKAGRTHADAPTLDTAHSTTPPPSQPPKG